jgi:hypothetical protein
MTRYHTKATVDENGKQTGQENVPFTVEEEAEADANDVASAAAEAEYIAKEKYKDDRRAAYPDIGDFADAYYWAQKGDDSKMTAYVAACAKVKTDNPKP